MRVNVAIWIKRISSCCFFLKKKIKVPTKQLVNLHFIATKNWIVIRVSKWIRLQVHCRLIDESDAFTQVHQKSISSFNSWTSCNWELYRGKELSSHHAHLDQTSNRTCPHNKWHTCASQIKYQDQWLESKPWIIHLKRMREGGREGGRGRLFQSYVSSLPAETSVLAMRTIRFSTSPTLIILA
jgi:hypothetical protein